LVSPATTAEDVQRLLDVFDAFLANWAENQALLKI
jgi:hypothetical protein